MADGIGAIFHDVEMYMYIRVIDVYKHGKARLSKTPKQSSDGTTCSMCTVALASIFIHMYHSVARKFHRMSKKTFSS